MVIITLKCVVVYGNGSGNMEKVLRLISVDGVHGIYKIYENNIKKTFKGRHDAI